jgi:hypothetical protein
MLVLRVGFASALLALVFACGGSSNNGSGFIPNSGGGNLAGGGDGGSSGSIGGNNGNGSNGSNGSGANDNCSDAAKLVYVVSEENDLYSFAPAAKTFTKIGQLDCQADGDQPNSMAVDRQGTAWVNYSLGTLFKVSTANAHCESTPFVAGQHGFGRFGMAFSSNSAGSNDETLFVVGIKGNDQGQGLATIDLSTFTLTPIGDFTGTLKGKGAELTGTGDATLFGFFTTQPDATLAAIDKSAGSTPSPKDLTGVNTGNDWAFSFWGGDFWFYTSDGVSPSTVTQLKASGDNSISTAVDDVGGFKIVGAGVSTCAPTVPPVTK